MNGSNGARVLVVDEDSDLVESYRHVFEMAGFEVDTALSGEAALGLVRSHRPDVVLTDVSMPSMDGFELIQRLKTEMGGQTPPVLVCSAFDMTEAEAVARGAELFLQKPASAATLVRSIEALCHGTRPDREALANERATVAQERRRQVRGSEVRLRGIDRKEVARESHPWLDWFRRYFDCESAGLFLLEGGAVLPLVSMGTQMSSRPEPRLLHVTLAAGVETGTSLVVRDMATHPSFRRVLGPRPDIASFGGVPLVTSDGVRIGALCLADSRPGRLDADSLVIMEYLGRRGVAFLFEKGTIDLVAMRARAPLLEKAAFDSLLAAELKIARRVDESIELAIGALTTGVSAESCADRIWRDSGRERMGIGMMGAGRVGIFVRGPAREVREHLSNALHRARAEGLFEAVGVAAVMASSGLSRQAVTELAESALSVAQTATTGPKIERIAVHSDSGNPIA